MAQLALEIDTELKGGRYDPAPEECAGIERGLRDAADGKFASPQQVEDVFARHRTKGRG